MSKPTPTLFESVMAICCSGGRRWPVAIATISMLTVMILISTGLFQPDTVAQHIKDAAAKVGNAAGTSTPQTLHSTSFGELHTLFDAASNRTLGLDSIQFINLPHRHDRYDSAFIQAYLSDIDLVRTPAVLAENVKDNGLPPTENPGRLKFAEIACWRAHANIWQMMLEKRIPALLVLEADAAWDLNIRSIFGTLNQPFRELLQEENPHAQIAIEKDDPWAARTGLWDLIAVGQCSGYHATSRGYRLYEDEHAAHSDFVWEHKNLNGKRVVYRANGAVCTTGYIISLRGAAKLLVRSAMDLNEPIDLIINGLAKTNHLTVYNVLQQLVAQWVYMPGVGMDARGANSDIQDPDGTSNSNLTDAQKHEKETNGWPKAKSSMSVWDLRWDYKDVAFKDMALRRAWDKVTTNPKPVWG